MGRVFTAIARSHTLIIIAKTVSRLGHGRVKPCVYFNPMAQPVSKIPAKIRTIHSIRYSFTNNQAKLSETKKVFIPVH
jgi:hypothetical protein